MKRLPAPRILILESQMIIAADLSLQLLKLGYDVIGMNTRAVDVLKTIESNRPDLVLMNIRMQGDGGHIKLAEIIMKTFQLPVIFLSAYTDQAILEQVIKVHPYAYITKPFEQEDLQRGLQTALDRMHLEGFGGGEHQQFDVGMPDAEPSGFLPLTIRKAMSAVRTVAMNAF